MNVITDSRLYILYIIYYIQPTLFISYKFLFIQSMFLFDMNTNKINVFLIYLNVIDMQWIHAIWKTTLWNTETWSIQIRPTAILEIFNRVLINISVYSLILILVVNSVCVNEMVMSKISYISSENNLISHELV